MVDSTRRRRRRKCDDTQQKLYFGPDWNEVRRQWRAIIHSMPASRCGLSRRRWHNIQRLLLAVLWFDQNGDGCWAGSESLSDETDLSRSTFGRAKRDARQLGVLEIERRSNAGPYGGRLTDRLRVDLKALASLGSLGATDQSDEARRHSDEARAQTDTYKKEETLESISPSRDGSRTTDEFEDWTDEQVSRVWSIRSNLIRKVGKLEKQSDLMDATKAVILSMTRFNEQWLWDAAEAVAVKQPAPQKPWAYFRRCLKEATRDLGEDLNVAMARTRVPPELLEKPRRPAC